MAVDVADILQKGRLPLDGLEIRLVSERRGEPPRYVTRVAFHFVVKGAVPADRVERASSSRESATARCGTASGPTSPSTRPSRSRRREPVTRPVHQGEAQEASPPSDPSAFHAFEQAGWESIPQAYQDAFGTLTTQAVGTLLDAARVGPGVHVLDVATGPGDVAAAAAGRGATVVGLDFSAGMLAEARRHHPGIDFRAGDATALPFPDASFDAVVMSFGLLHLAHPDQALAEGRRVLRAGGRLAFTVWEKPDASIGFGIVLRAIQRHGRLDVPLPPGPPFFRFSDPEECRRTLLAVGFEAPAVTTVPQVWRLASLDALFDVMRGGTVRTAGLLRAQTPEAQDAIRAEIREAVRPYQHGSVIEIPMPAVLASAVRR